MCGVFGVCVIKMYKQRRYREREMKAVKLQQLEFLLLYFQATTSQYKVTPQVCLEPVLLASDATGEGP